MSSVLIVDDDAAIRENICDLFAGTHFCQSAASAEEALAMMASQQFDVVITDISMPGMSGVELFGQIRQSQPDTPVIFLSAIGDEAYRTGVLGLGAYAYHCKPYTLSEIEASVAGALEHHRQVAAARPGYSGDELMRAESKLYALSLFAAKPDSLETEHDAKVMFASSEGEAKAKGIDYANEKWPRSDGWVKHHIVAVEVQPDIISKARH